MVRVLNHRQLDFWKNMRFQCGDIAYHKAVRCLCLDKVLKRVEICEFCEIKGKDILAL